MSGKKYSDDERKDFLDSIAKIGVGATSKKYGVSRAYLYSLTAQNKKRPIFARCLKKVPNATTIAAIEEAQDMNKLMDEINNLKTELAKRDKIILMLALKSYEQQIHL